MMCACQVSLDTASFEVVTNCWPSLLHLLQQGLVDILLCNEDEALAVAKVQAAPSPNPLPFFPHPSTPMLPSLRTPKKTYS